MSATLADKFPANASDPSKAATSTSAVSLFSETERDRIKEFTRLRECTDQSFPPSCDINLVFGFFFDGTNNNLKRDAGRHTHSNVARLYQAFPGGKDAHGSPAWPELKTKYHNSFFRTYIPGVGTEFDEVGDSGKGFSLSEDRPRGLAFCYLGQNRIIWALTEVINNLHRYYTDAPMIGKDEFKARFNKLTLPGFDKATGKSYARDNDDFTRPSDMQLLESAFTEALKNLHSRLESYVPPGPGKSRDKGKVIRIYASMFGFSRGATKARAFSNWFVWLCQLDARLAGGTGMSLGGIPVAIDFVGLFDTVASVGFAASTLFADGHQAWADAEVSLRIPQEAAQCLHLVSGHETRRSFPLDSVLHKGLLPSNCKEVVFPGVHSDIGGGYAPTEQGRGKDPEGADLISRITLATMYRAARLAGVPLKLEEAPDTAKRAFRIDPSLIQAFNAYISACTELNKTETDKPVSGALHTLMEAQHKLYIQWRKKMLGKMTDLPEVRDGNKHDREDILEADREFRKEVGYFENWRRSRYHGDIEKPPSVPEWESIDDYWDQTAPPPVTDFFDRFVHDSRAWFKPLGKDLPDLQHHLDMLAVQNEKAREWDANHPSSSESNPYELDKRDEQKLKRYELYKAAHPDSDDLSESIDPESKGREPMWLGGGYLRYRRIYMGSDSYRPYGAKYAGLAPASNQAGGRFAGKSRTGQVEIA